jgi:hypothetical protein
MLRVQLNLQDVNRVAEHLCSGVLHLEDLATRQYLPSGHPVFVHERQSTEPSLSFAVKGIRTEAQSITVTNYYGRGPKPWLTLAPGKHVILAEGTLTLVRSGPANKACPDQYAQHDRVRFNSRADPLVLTVLPRPQS